VGEKAGAPSAAGVVFLEGRRVAVGSVTAGEGAASTFMGGSGTSSGNTVTPIGGDGGGIDGNSMLSVFDDLVVRRCLGTHNTWSTHPTPSSSCRFHSSKSSNDGSRSTSSMSMAGKADP
jgi:hypothetical protein